MKKYQWNATIEQKNIHFFNLVNLDFYYKFYFTF